MSILSRRDAQADPQASDGIVESIRAWAVALVGDRRFRRLATAFPLSRPFVRREARAVFDLCAGFVYSQVLLACVRLRVLDHLHETPCTPSDLAMATGLDVGQAQRLLDAAVALGLVRRQRGCRYALAARGAVVRGDPGLVEMIEHHALVYRDLADPVALLRGEAAPGSLRGYWGYARAADPTSLSAADVAAYSRLMALSQPPVAEEIV
ncbi:MAG: MarR family transcriptional regulator, partial [Alphaproteobacteria bacterium]|nr:MarR family transcriptional regulator [Alphaproteobacteria bacterium]